MELEQRLQELEKELQLKTMEADFWEFMIDKASKEFKIDIKKSLAIRRWKNEGAIPR